MRIEAVPSGAILPTGDTATSREAARREFELRQFVHLDTIILPGAAPPTSIDVAQQNRLKNRFSFQISNGDFG